MKGYTVPMWMTRSAAYKIVFRKIGDIYAEKEDVATAKKYIEYIEGNRKFFEAFNFDEFERRYEDINPKSYLTDAKRLFAHAYDAIIRDHDLEIDGVKLHEGRETRWEMCLENPAIFRTIAEYFTILSTHPYNECTKYHWVLYFGDLELDCNVSVVKRHDDDAAEIISVDVTCGHSRVILKIRYNYDTDYYKWFYYVEEKYGKTFIESSL